MWNPTNQLITKIKGLGGFVNSHAHFDRAYSIDPADFRSDNKGINSTVQEKWHLVDTYKKNSTEESYYEHIFAALSFQKEQGVQACLSFIDCDEIAEERAMKAAIKAKKIAAEVLKMRFLIASQTLKGVLNPVARTWFEKSLDYVDVIGGLPGADPGKEAEHLDVLFEAAKRTKKRVHVHVDQLNSAKEKETELLAKKTMEWGLEGQVTAIHGISIGAHPKQYRQEVYKLAKEANLSFVACPTAWIDCRKSEVLVPTHNAITPIDEMIEHGLTVALGSDNICDIYKPYADGNMLTELRLLLEANHFYEEEELLKIATSNGLKVMGIL
jgi:cytosine deaminase